MLNYILVLGQIPGTNIQITFNELLGIIDLAVFALVFRGRIDRKNITARFNYLARHWRVLLFIRKGGQLSLQV